MHLSTKFITFSFSLLALVHVTIDPSPKWLKIKLSGKLILALESTLVYFCTHTKIH